MSSAEKVVDSEIDEALDLLDGCHVEPDYEKAYARLSAQAASGNLTVRRSLAYMYREGLGVAADVGKAIQMYEELFQRGDFMSGVELARIYAGLSGSRGGPAQAAYWYQKALALPEVANHPEVMQEACAYMRSHPGYRIDSLVTCPGCHGLFDPRYAVRYEPKQWYLPSHPYLKCPTCSVRLSHSVESNPARQAAKELGNLVPVMCFVLMISGALYRGPRFLWFAIYCMMVLPAIAMWWEGRKEKTRYVVAYPQPVAMLQRVLLLVRAAWLLAGILLIEYGLLMILGSLILVHLDGPGLRFAANALCFWAGAWVMFYCAALTLGQLSYFRALLIGLGVFLGALVFRLLLGSGGSVAEKFVPALVLYVPLAAMPWMAARLRGAMLHS